jgi:hypothetical protein
MTIDEKLSHFYDITVEDALPPFLKSTDRLWKK